MKPSPNNNKLSAQQNQQDQQPDIADIAYICQMLNNSKPSVVKPYSQYDPQSMFPPPSLLSANNNDNQSDKSKSNNLNFSGFFKRPSVVEAKQEKEGSHGSKYETISKKVKRIQVQKLSFTNILMQTNSINNTLIVKDNHKEQQVASNKNSQLVQKDHQQILKQPQTNFKITDFFSFKQHLTKPVVTTSDKKIIFQFKKPEKKIIQKLQKNILKDKTDLQQQKTNTIVASLMQKNSKKKKAIQQLKKQLQLIKLRKIQNKSKLSLTRQQQKLKLKRQLLQTNQHKMQYQQFKSQMHSFLDHTILRQKLVPEIQVKLKSLEEYKKKGTKKGANRKQIHTDEESLGNNAGNQQASTHYQHINHIPDKKNYINQWMGKLDKFREKLNTDKNVYDILFRANQKYQQIPEQIQTALQSSAVLTKDYALYSVQNPFSIYFHTPASSTSQWVQINSFNLQHLRPQILTVKKYPKFSTFNRKIQIQKQLQNLFKLSKKLHNSAGFYFLQTTLALQIGQNNDYIIYGRQKNQGYQNLLQSLNKYETFNQTMVRYLARVCLIAFEEMKVKVDIPCFILPLNVYFTPKYDIKFSNILFNKLLLSDEFRPYLKDQKFYYFVAPQALSQKDLNNISLWSLGILLFYIIYEKYPFEYDYQASFQKETFFIYNELTFPSKPVISEKSKDFITTCLQGKQKDFNNLLKHQFFHK